MNIEQLKNNRVELMGKITKEFTFSHELLGESFCESEISTVRLSGTEDRIPVLISDRVIEQNKTYEGKTVFINGEFRSRNTEDGKLALYVFVHEIEIFDELDGGDTNMIILNGYLCKKPTYRKTPYGREISDLFIAVYRHTGKSDYIPCVAWGRNAKFAFEIPVGSHVRFDGRIQSRNYLKRYPDGSEKERTAYEVSVSRIEVLEDGEE